MKSISLNGAWKLRWSDGQRGRPEYAEREETDESRYIDAVVPGDVHDDLLRAGLITDPYKFSQAKNCRWVEDNVWSYRRFFEVSSDDLSSHAWLNFEILDLNARILLNGEQIGTHCNYFRPCRIEVTGKLREGKNLLTVHVDSGLFSISEKPHSGYLLQGFDQKLHKRHWLRKPQSQFSWDWAPRLLNIGIPGNVALCLSKSQLVLETLVVTAELDEDQKMGRILAKFHTDYLGVDQTEILLFVSIAGQSAELRVLPVKGKSSYEVPLEIPNPTLWWPRNLGEQYLYDVTATVSETGCVLETRKRKVGFRNVRVNQEHHPVSGRYFIFEINGRPIFLKGANLIPGELIYCRMTPDRYGILLDRACEANFNFLRIWGGGVYETDHFYERCDEIGILIWQDFVYACGKYPMQDAEFFRNATSEAVYQIRRLAHHPSLIAWCGNNEISMFNEWSISDEGIVRPDHGFFNHTLPTLIKSEDPGRYYQPSSPHSPEYLPANQDDVGDQHPWSIGFHDVDFFKYREMICRFPNEGGFLGPSSLPSIEECLPDGQQFVGSHAWQFHDNSVDSWAEPSPVDNITTEWLGKSVRDLSLEEFCYWAGLVQGEALREYIEVFRRQMFSSSCACFWMFNDCWPTTRSWAIVDYQLRRTPSFHTVKRAFQEINVALAVQDSSVVIVGINDTRDTFHGTLQSGVFELNGAYPLNETGQVVIPPNSAVTLARFPAHHLNANRGAFAVLSDVKEEMVAKNRLFTHKFKELNWPSPNIRVYLEDNTACYESDVFVWGVCLDLNGTRELSDNFFDLYPGLTHRIELQGTELPQVLYTGNLIANS